MVEIKHPVEDEMEFPSEDGDGMCPYMERLGVCLEPEACFMRHEFQFNMRAQEFVPNFSNPVPMPKDESQSASLVA